MTQPSSYRRVVAAVAAAASLALGAMAVTPAAAGAATHKHAHKHAHKSKGVVIRLERSKEYGKVLAEGAGQSLYYLSARGGKSLECKGACTSIWPPVLSKHKPRAAKGVESKKLGRVKRGSTFQVTYDGHPLYRYAGDTRAGQVKGEKIHNFGGTWYLLARKGAPVRAALASARTSGGSSKGSGGSSKGSGGSSKGSGGSSKGSGGW